MIKVGVFSDIHGNLPALEAVLNAFDDAGCDVIYHLGDAVDIGPFPSECVDALLARRDVVMLMGNHERYASHGIPEPRPSYISDGEVEHISWTRSCLRPDQVSRLQVLPLVQFLEYKKVTCVFIHCPLADDKIDFRPLKPDDPLESALSGMGVDAVFFGHTHGVLDHDGVLRMHNPGAAGTVSGVRSGARSGQSAGAVAADGARWPAKASFSILRLNAGDYEITRHTAEYDLQPVLDALDSRQVPDREFLKKAFFGQG